MPVDLPATRSIISSFFARTNIPYPKLTPDPTFSALCYADFDRRLSQYPHTTPADLSAARSYMKAGIDMATTGYAHIPSVRVRIFIAMFTMFFLYVDDVAERNGIEDIKDFNRRFSSQDGHRDGVLDAYDAGLREMHEIWKPEVANMMQMSFLNLSTAILLEKGMENVEVRNTKWELDFHYRLRKLTISPHRSHRRASRTPTSFAS